MTTLPDVGTTKRHSLVKRISHVPRYFSFYEEYTQMCAIRGIKVSFGLYYRWYSSGPVVLTASQEQQLELAYVLRKGQCFPNPNICVTINSKVQEW